MNVQLDHVAIQVKNIDRAIKWYTNNLSAETLYSDETWAMLKVGDFRLALVKPEQHPSHIAICVPSKECLIGGKVRVHRDGSSYIYKADSEGNIIELICWEK